MKRLFDIQTGRTGDRAGPLGMDQGGRSDAPLVRTGIVVCVRDKCVNGGGAVDR